ncbi:MAG: dockerin type I repeat-containing protein, partial [Clostridia bacterium]|nr:dockerin type I repeat-containing protein [Clostridia bacterium]
EMTTGDAGSTVIEPQTFADVSAADGSMAYFLNDGHSDSVWTCANGHTVWGDATNRTGKVSLELGTGSSVIETKNYYLNAGESFVLPTFDGYELDESTLPVEVTEGSFRMGSEDVTITYLISGVNLSLLTDLLDQYASLDMDLFVDSSGLEALVATLEEAYDYYTGSGEFAEDGPPDLTDPEVIAYFNEEYDAWVKDAESLDLTLVDTYPHYPAYADHEFFEDINTSKNWAISTKEDWYAVIDAAKSNHIYDTFHVTNDIDFGNVKMDALGYGVDRSFYGTLDGHGYAFKNIYIEYADQGKNHIGLIGQLYGTIENLGIASGLVKTVYTAGDGFGVGALAGASYGGSNIINCWNAATVTSTTASGVAASYLSVAGIVGRGMSTSLMSGCYNIGTVSGTNHAVDLNDWGQNSAFIYNSFGAGELKAGSTGLFRFNSGTNGELVAGSSDQIENVWAVGNNFSAANTAAINTAMNAYLLDADAYETGEVGYRINQGYVSGKGERVYFTYVDGKTVHGTAGNQTRKVTLHNDSITDDIVFYAAAGSTVDLSEYVIGATFAVAEGSEGTVAEKALTVPNSDPIINYEMSGLSYVDLKAAIDAWDGLNFDYFVGGDETAALVETATEKMLADTYEDQDAVDADTAALNAAHVYKDYPNLPTTSEIEEYPDAPGYVIMSEDDYINLTLKDETIAATKTIYLGADVTMTDASTNLTLSALVATFDGKDHSITGLKVNSGLFNSITTLRNTTFIDCQATACGWNSALLINQTAKNNILMENLTFVNCKSTKTSSNGISLMIAQFTGDKLTYKNIVVDGCTLNIVANAGMCNVGFLGGTHSGTNITVEDVIVKNSHIESATTSNGSGRGLVFGEQTGATATYKNIALYNNTSAHPAWGVNGSVVGVFKNNATATATNIVAYNNLSDDHPESHWTGNLFDGANVNDEHLVTTNVSARYAASAYATAYANNQVEGAKTWAINPDGEVVFATEGLPVKVSFVVGEETFDYYTDNAGTMLLVDTEMIAANEWDKEIAAVHTEDTVYTAKTCDHVMEEEWTHIEGTETHKRACTLGCGYEETADCEYTSVVTEPTCCAAGYTTKTCNHCGNVIIEEGAPATNDHAWGDWFVETPATTTEPGVEKRVCSNDGCSAFETQEIPVLEYAIGDTNGDGTMNSADVVMLMKRVASGNNPEGFVEAVADINEDGQINSADTVALMKKVSAGA